MMTLVTIVKMVLMLYLVIFSWYALPQVDFYLLSKECTPNMTDLNIIAINLYHPNCFSKLLKMTRSIVDGKPHGFRLSWVAVVALAVVAYISINFFISCIIDSIFYYLNYNCKLLKMTWCIVDWKTYKLKLYVVDFVAVRLVACVSDNVWRQFHYWQHLVSSQLRYQVAQNDLIHCC